MRITSSSVVRRAPRSTLVPYTTLFRSKCRIDAPPGHDADVLDAVHREGRRRCDDAGVRGELPQQLPGARIEGAEIPVMRSARDRKSTRLNSSHLGISYAVFCLKKKKEH